jgi:aminocarboxymuconate-semialdehyde decarboxylase
VVVSVSPPTVGEIELVFLIEPVASWLSEAALQRARAMMFCDLDRECEECQLMGEMQMTTNRREVLCRTAGALTGLAFTGCGLLNRALAEEPQRRREVIVNGKRVRTVDVHAHCHIPEANALMGLKVQLPSLVISPERIKVMDEQGIDIEALSINPIFWSKAEPDVAGQVVKLQNEKLSDICAAQPDRFVGLASVALQHPDLAAEQLEHAVKQLGLRGALIGGSVNGEELSDPKFHPFWAKAEQLGVLIFIHPQGTAELSTSGRLKGNGVLDNVIGNPLETTIALSHLIFEGTLDAYPGLKICAAHAGGYLPSYAARSDQGCVTFPQRCTKTLKQKPTEYLRQLYYDSMVFTKAVWEAKICSQLVDVLGAHLAVREAAPALLEPLDAVLLSAWALAMRLFLVRAHPRPHHLVQVVKVTGYRRAYRAQ